MATDEERADLRAGETTPRETPLSGSEDGLSAGGMDRLAWFGALWAAAVLIHQGSYGEWSTDPLDLALTAAATSDPTK